MTRRHFGGQFVSMDSARRDPQQAGACSRAHAFRIGLVDMAREVNVSATFEPTVRFSLISEPIVGEWMMAEHNHNFVIILYCH